MAKGGGGGAGGVLFWVWLITDLCTLNSQNGRLFRTPLPPSVQNNILTLQNVVSEKGVGVSCRGPSSSPHIS